MKAYRLLCFACLGMMLWSCSTSKDRELTIRDLQKKRPPVQVNPSEIDGAGRKIIKKQYREFLNSAKQEELKAEAMRRLADLEMMEHEEKASREQGAGKKNASGSSKNNLPDPVDARQAVKLYSNLLKTYPNDRRNDKVLYQLANAYDLAGEPKNTLKTLDTLVKQYPQSRYTIEAQFRRGELNFLLRRYHLAEKAYRVVLSQGQSNEYYVKALHKYGWSLYQQYVYVEAIATFTQLLDILIGSPSRFQQYMEKNPMFRAGDRELVEDTLRVISLCLFAKEKGATIEAFAGKYRDKNYESLVFQRLGQMYIDRKRLVDATETFKLYMRSHQNDPQAALFNISILEAYEKNKSAQNLLSAKEKFVDSFHFNRRFWDRNTNPTLKARVAPHLKKNIKQLAQHYHAESQKSKKPADYEKSQKWYRLYVENFADDKQTPYMHFMFAESLFESKKYELAAKAYEASAYRYQPHKNAAAAGYAAIVCYQELEKATDYKRQAIAWQRRGIDNALRFADSFPKDKRAAEVVLNAAQVLYKNRNYLEAVAVANRVLTLNPLPSRETRVQSWVVIAHSQFEQDHYSEAESAYRHLLTIMDQDDGKQKEIKDRLAASIYKQGENLKRQGNEKAAYLQFRRVSQMAPGSAVAVAAHFDSAVSLLSQKQWLPAIEVLKEFRGRYPNNKLNKDIPEKLYFAYMESKQFGKAAVELEKMAESKTSATERREVMLRSAELYEKSNKPAQAERIYKKYVSMFPFPLEMAMETRNKLAQMALARKNWREHNRWLREMVAKERQGASQRTDRTRYLAATSALKLAEPLYASFSGVRLVHPLKKNLKKKKSQMEKALKAYSLAADYKIAEVTTASTFKIAKIYSEFGKALMKSQRPKGLNQNQLTQYENLLEEQAFPFEEKSIKIHEANTRRASQGLYDQWVDKSFKALRKMLPARYAKVERSEAYIDVLQ